MKKQNKIIIFLILLIVICIGIIIFILMNKQKPDYAPIEIDPNVVETDKSGGKLETSQGGGAVSLSYNSKVEINLNDKKVTLKFKNPYKSTQNMKLQVIIEDNTIAESELIPPGYSIYNLDLKDNIILKKGNYEGKFKIQYYSEENQENAIIDTDIPVEISVK